MDEHIRLLTTFSITSGMEINWDKYCAYRFDKFIHRHVWLQDYDRHWEEEADLSKL